MYVRCESVPGHCRVSLTCAYLFANSVHNDESAGHTGIRVQVPLSDTSPLRMLRSRQSWVDAVDARLTVDIRVTISAYRIEKTGDDHPYM